MNRPSEPWMTAAAPRAVLAALDGAEGSTRFVGGCVRAIVRRETPDDIDLATIFPPEEVMRRLDAAGIRAMPTGLAHGTVTAVLDKIGIEVTTLRQDVETDGRRAVVAFTTDWRVDAERRDFTMNAMSLTADGNLHDYFEGARDALDGRVRFVGDAELRIREDVLRILRFFRFHAWYGQGAPDSTGLAACRDLADLMPNLSRERIGKEMLKLLAAPAPAKSVRTMADCGVLAHILPGTADLAAFSRLLELDKPTDAVLRLAVLNTGPIGPVTTSLRLSKAESARLDRMADLELAPSAGERAWKEFIYHHGRDSFRDSMLVRAARGADFSTEMLADALRFARNWEAPDLPIAGRDLRALGVASGPGLGELLRRVERWWIDGDFAADKSACLEQAALMIARGD
jgi:poly(A) polymerase